MITWVVPAAGENVTVVFNVDSTPLCWLSAKTIALYSMGSSAKTIAV